MAALAKSIGDQTAETNTAHMVFTADAGGEKINGEGDLKFGARRPGDDDGHGHGRRAHVDGAARRRAVHEAAAGIAEPGKPWIKIDSNDKSNPMAQALGSMTEQMSKNADPRATLEQFEESGEITDTKEEDLDGQKTTHYTITVDVQKLAENQNDATMKKAMQDAIKSGLKDFPVDAVGQRGRPAGPDRDRHADAGPDDRQDHPVKMQIDYTKWGEPVDIPAPPADQVADLPP